MSELKYKVGDRVRIKSIDWYNDNKGNDGIVELSTADFIPEMLEHCGTIVTIDDVFEDIGGNVVYHIEEDIIWDWTDEMIEGLVEEEEASTKPEKMSTHSTFVETARGYLVEALSDLNVIDVSHMSDLEKSSLYCAKENIKDALNLLEE